MTWLFSLLTWLPGFLNGLLTYLNKKQDNALEQFRIGNTNGRDVSIEAVKAEQSRIAGLQNVALAGMARPVWWVAWALGVFPVLGYHACIFWVSTFPGLGWSILKVPADQIEFGKLVVMSLFGYGAVSSLTNTIVNKWGSRA